MPLAASRKRVPGLRAFFCARHLPEEDADADAEHDITQARISKCLISRPEPDDVPKLWEARAFVHQAIRIDASLHELVKPFCRIAKQACGYRHAAPIECNDEEVHHRTCKREQRPNRPPMVEQYK